MVFDKLPNEKPDDGVVVDEDVAVVVDVSEVEGFKPKLNVVAGVAGLAGDVSSVFLRPKEKPFVFAAVSVVVDVADVVDELLLENLKLPIPVDGVEAGFSVASVVEPFVASFFFSSSISFKYFS